MRTRLAPLALAASSLLLAPLARPALAAGQGGPFLHVEVDDHGKDGTQLRLNLPLAVAELALDLAQNQAIAGGHIKIDTREIKVADLRRLWSALKAGGDAELVQAKTGKESVSVAQKGGRVLITVTEEGRGKPKINVDVPVAAVDALLSGDGETLDLRSALAELNADARGEFIRVEDGDTNVRVWIE